MVVKNRNKLDGRSTEEQRPKPLSIARMQISCQMEKRPTENTARKSWEQNQRLKNHVYFCRQPERQNYQDQNGILIQ